MEENTKTGGIIDDMHVNLALESTYKCTWELKNFSQRYKNLTDIRSDNFVAGDYKICILLTMKDRDLAEHEPSSVKKLQEKYDQSNGHQNVHIDLCFLKNNGEESQENMFVLKKYDGKNCSVVLLVQKSYLFTDILTDNILKILCKVVINPSIIQRKQKKDLVYLAPIHQLKNDFDQFLNNEQFSDVKFVVGNQSFYAHKIMLANKSRVFAAMFTTEMIENKKNIVVLEDIEIDTFKELLRYIYEGKTMKINEIAEELLVAADKYEITGLVHMCTEILYNRFTVHNALHLLQLADKLNIQKIKRKALELIKAHATYLADKPEFHDLPKDLIVEVLREVANPKKRKLEFP